jgi:hypothetical protein
MSPSQRCDHILDLINEVIGTPAPTPRATLPAPAEVDATPFRRRARGAGAWSGRPSLAR